MSVRHDLFGFSSVLLETVGCPSLTITHYLQFLWVSVFTTNGKPKNCHAIVIHTTSNQPLSNRRHEFKIFSLCLQVGEIQSLRLGTMLFLPLCLKADIQCHCAILETCMCTNNFIMHTLNVTKSCNLIRSSLKGQLQKSSDLVEIVSCPPGHAEIQSWNWRGIELVIVYSTYDKEKTLLPSVVFKGAATSYTITLHWLEA